MTLFEYLNAMTYQKLDLNEHDLVEYDQYMMSQWLSMVEVFIPVVNSINGLQMSNKSHYCFFKTMLPKQKIYFKYLSRKKEVTNKELRYITDYFSVGIREAELYINMLSDDMISVIIDTYRHGTDKLLEL